MRLEGYENRFVAFIDILGFKQLIENIENEKNGYENDFKRLKSVLNFLHKESIESNGAHDLLIFDPCDDSLLIELGNPRITSISDCVIISTDGTFDGFKSLCNKITKFSTDLASEGIFLRGRNNIWTNISPRCNALWQCLPKCILHRIKTCRLSTNNY